MTRKLTRNYSLSVVIPFIAILTLLIAVAMVAQTSGSGQTTEKSNVVLAPGSSAAAQARRSLTPGADGTGRFPVSRSQTKPHRARPLDPNPLFLPVATYDSGGQDAYSVAIADVNGDGKPDLVVANLCNSKCKKKNSEGLVEVMLGNGDGTFQPAAAYPSGGLWALAVAIADLNGDGKLDLVVGGDTYVAVMLGNGDGTFQPAVTYNSGTETPYNVVIADLNGDGKLDVVVGGVNSSAVGVMLGNGDGTLQPVVTYNPGGWGPGTVAVADVNLDGIPDIVVANAGNGNVGVLLGNGDGTFQPAVTYGSGGTQPAGIAVADLNGDGKPDIVVTNFQSSNVAILLGNGDGTFQPAVAYGSGGGGPGPTGPSSVAVADVNGDGIPDLAISSTLANYEVSVLLGNGDGSFQAPVTYYSGGCNAVYIAFADVNGDGAPDLLVTNLSVNCGAGDGRVGVLLHNNPTTTALTSSLNPSNYGQTVTFTAAVSAYSGTATGTVSFYDGSTQLGSATLANGSVSLSTSSLAAGPHSITAAYQGYSAFQPSTSAPLDQVVNGVSTSTSLVSLLNPSLYGQAVTFTAAVSTASGTPTGTVIFYDGSTAIGSATLTNGTASTSVSTLAAGSHSITAAYQGSGDLDPSTSAPLNQIVNPVSTSTSLVSSANPARNKQKVTYTATVTSQFGGAATGTATFQDNGATIATVALSGNQAAYTISYPSEGIHLITATYSGDASNAGSISPVLIEDIGKPPFVSETTLATSGSPSQIGQPVTFTATVSSKYGTIPDGELVTFYNGKTEMGTGVTASGIATFITSSLTVGKHAIKGTYAGDAQFKPSSGKVTQVVEN
jgi:uncharacterized membrane protein